MERLITAIILALVIGSAGNALATEVYRWTDDEGRVHYTATPPSDRDITVIKVTDGGAAPGSSSSDAGATAEDEAVTQRRQHCDTARHNLELLEDERIETFLDADGATVRFEADERAALLAETQAQVQYFCR